MRRQQLLRMSRLWAVARKELLQLRRDPRSLGLAFVLPLVLLILFGYAITTDVDHIRAAVYDRDRSVESRELAEAFERSGYFTFTEAPTSDTDVERLINKGDVRLVLVIPERFAADLAARRPAPVELLLDGSDAKTATVARGYADAIAQTFSSNLHVATRAVPPPVRAEGRVWYNETLDSKAMVIPGLVAVIMSIIAAMLTSLTIAREWERGTMEQLAATPVSRAEVILGKLAPYLAIGIVDVAIALLVGVFVFDVPFRGSIALFALSSVIFLIGVLGLGTVISSSMKSQLLATQASIFATFLPAMIFSGFMFTLSNMPVLLQLISRVVPARYFIAVSRGLFLKGVGFSVLWPSLLGLTLYAVLTVGMSIKRFRKELV